MHAAQGTYRDEYGKLVLGDVIVGFNGQKVKSEQDLYNYLDGCKVCGIFILVHGIFIMLWGSRVWVQRL